MPRKEDCDQIMSTRPWSESVMDPGTKKWIKRAICFHSRWFGFMRRKCTIPFSPQHCFFTQRCFAVSARIRSRSVLLPLCKTTVAVVFVGPSAARNWQWALSPSPSLFTLSPSLSLFCLCNGCFWRSPPPPPHVRTARRPPLAWPISCSLGLSAGCISLD